MKQKYGKIIVSHFRGREGEMVDYVVFFKGKLKMDNTKQNTEENIPRTQNSAESWHCKLNPKTGFYNVMNHSAHIDKV